VTVLYFADTRFPIERANGVQTMATCQALAARGHDVTLVTRPDTGIGAPRDPFAFYGLPPTPTLTWQTIPARTDRRASRVAFLVGALAMTLGHREAVVYTRDLGLAAFLARVPATRRPRLIYESHGIAPVVSAELPMLLGQPALAPSAAKLRRLDRRERRVWTRAAGYVTITRALADDLAARYGPRPDVVVAPDGAAETPAAPTQRDASPVGAYAGHLYPWKGADVFVRALAHAPNVRGLIVGGHPAERDRARIDALAATLGVADRLEMTGLVPSSDVGAHLARATVLVLPNVATTISDRYTSPLKLFEYLWTGLPIVASDLAAIREVLTDGRTALLVPPGDVGALARALVRVSTDRTLASALGTAARALAPQFTWHARAARLEVALAGAAAAS
jgi:glycosyltransferase involved in cell wall biosynthesis